MGFLGLRNLFVLLAFFIIIAGAIPEQSYAIPAGDQGGKKVRLQAESPGIPQEGSINIDGDATLGGNLYVNGDVGIGTDSPQAPLHIRGNVAAGNGIQNHVVIIENLNSGDNTNGLAIKLRNASTVNRSNNYITFYNDTINEDLPTDVAGRIEGMSLDDYEKLLNVIEDTVIPNFPNPFTLFKIDLGIEFHEDFFDPGSFPAFDLNPGSFPTPNLSRGSLPSFHVHGLDPELHSGSLPSLSITSGSLPELDISGGSLPTVSDPFTFNVPSISIDYDKLDDFVQAILDDDDVESGTIPTALRIFVAGPVKTAIETSLIALQGGGVTYESGAGDYAEWLERINAEEKMQFGDVVGIFGGKISKKTEGADQVMVVSYRPIVLGNTPPISKKELYEKIAFMGQVAVKVKGLVSERDYIVPSGYEDGTAIAISPDNMTADLIARVIGISWGESDFEGLKFVKVAVGLRPMEFAKVVKVQEAKISILESEVKQLRAARVRTVGKIDELSAKLEQTIQGMKNLNRLVNSKYGSELPNMITVVHTP